MKLVHIVESNDLFIKNIFISFVELTLRKKLIKNIELKLLN